jgi:hypothetical protein
MANHHFYFLAYDLACRLQVTFVLNPLSVAVSDHYRETGCNSIFALFIILHALRLPFFNNISSSFIVITIALIFRIRFLSFFSHIVSRFPIYPFALLLLLLFTVNHTHTHCLPICKITLPEYCTYSSELHAREHPHTQRTTK